jgi:hypothetical protein
MVQKDSNLIRIYDKGHNYSVEDKIVVKNVKNKNNIFSNGLIFLKNSFYVLVYHKNHSIDLNYKRYNSTFEISLSSVIGIFDQNYIDNIPINLLNTIHDIIIYSDDILEILSIKSGYKVIVDEMYKYLDYLKNEENDKFQNIIQNYYLIRLPIKYKNINSQISLTTETDNTGIEFQTYTYPGNTTIEINNIGGIAFNLINANFPINYLQKQGFHTITKIERDYFYFESSIKAYKTIEKAGGNDVVISKVINFVEGYPNSNNYKILLKKTFYNIKSIELVSSEFPSTEKIIKSDGDLKNNIIQWQNIEDGDYIYSITVPKGNYNRLTLTNTILDKMNKVERVISDTNFKYYHQFELNIDISTDEVVFDSYQEVTLSKPFSVEYITLNNEQRIILVITHPNNSVEVGDEIKISGSKSTNGISAQVINTTHFVYDINTSNDLFSITS